MKTSGMLAGLALAMSAGGALLSPAASADTGGYAGLAVGTTKVREEGPYGDEYDGYGGSGAAVFGGLSLGEVFAVEAGLRDYGSFTVETGATSVETSLQAFTVGPVARIPLTRNVRLTGRLDFVDWQIDQELSGYQDYKENGATIGLAFGFEADVTEHFGLRAGVDVFSFETRDHYEENVTHVSLGAQVMF